MDVSRLLQPIPRLDEEERHGHRGQEAGVQESAGDFDQGEKAVVWYHGGSVSTEAFSELLIFSSSCSPYSQLGCFLEFCIECSFLLFNWGFLHPVHVYFPGIICSRMNRSTIIRAQKCCV